MFASSQIEPLFGLITELNDAASNEGCESGLTVVDTVALYNLVQEAKRLRNLNQRLILGQHMHSHGYSEYTFLVPQGFEFGKALLEARLQEDFEPEIGESLNVNTVDEPTVITGTEELEAIVAFIHEHDEWWADQLEDATTKDGGDKTLISWFRYAQNAHSIQDAQQLLMKFVAFVENGLISWLEDDDDSTENILFDKAATSIGKSDEEITAIKARVLEKA